jgi:hypothetical protein
MKKIIALLPMFLIACTKNLPFEHQEGQHFEIWATSKIVTSTPGAFCPDDIKSHRTDSVYWNIEHPNTAFMLNYIKLDSTVNGNQYLTRYDSLIAEGTTYGPLK